MGRVAFETLDINLEGSDELEIRDDTVSRGVVEARKHRTSGGGYETSDRLKLDAEVDRDSDSDSDSDSAHADWQNVDRELRSIARRQSCLDAELMIALRSAERVRLWREVGCASMMEYLERVFGYSPRVAQERLRTARKLELLPELAQALADNELPFSAVRELTRIATPETAQTWRAAARGKCLREIEQMISGRREGDLPTSPKQPELETATVYYERVRTTTRALEREARKALDTERGERLDDDAFLAALYELALGAAATGVGDRAKFQVVHYQCDECGRTQQLGGGIKVDVDEAAVERGTCDAEHLHLDAPDNPVQDIPKKVRRFVELRDGKRCRIPGCRSTRNLELHHIVHREHGGSHDPENIIVACNGHHDAHHRGVLWIGGTASQLEVRRFDEPIASGYANVAIMTASVATHATAGIATNSVSKPPTDSPDIGRSDTATCSSVNIPVDVPTHGAGRRVSASVPAGRVPANNTVHLASTRSASSAASSTEASTTARVHARPSRPSVFDQVEIRTLACGAIRRLGWKPAVAAKAVDAVLAERGTNITIETLIREALPRCRD